MECMEDVVLCNKHLEPVKFFCEEDEGPICVVCLESQDHNTHSVLPIEEAAQERKAQIQKALETIKATREAMVGLIFSGKDEIENLLNQTTLEMQTALTEFKELHQFLEEEERLLVAQLGKANEEIVKKQYKYASDLAEAISLRDGFIQEMEEKCNQPAGEFLQDIKSTLRRCEEEKQETFDSVVAFCPGLKQKIIEITCQIYVMKNSMEQFKDTLSSTRLESKAENVLLDPETAYPGLHLSKDQKRVHWATKWKMLPSSALRFDSEACVLSSCGFTFGKRFWVVEIEKEEGGWAIGVAKESINRKGLVRITSEAGIWAVLFNGTTYGALFSPLQMIVKVTKKLTKVHVCLDFEKEQVIFADADTMLPLFTYEQITFSGEKLYPWLKVGNGSVLRLWP